MQLSVGDPVPSATFMTMVEERPTVLTTEGVFSGKRVAVFGLPGAYTPVCSNQHLPGVVAGARQLRAKELDAIACVSVNDPFVMAAWGKEQGADEIMMLADPEGEFTRGMGLAVDLSEYGLGQRSERYSMIVQDGTIQVLNVEASILDHGPSSCQTLVGQA
jgi:peroxiredoxin